MNRLQNLESSLVNLTLQIGLRYHLLIEEYSIKIKYIKDEKNIVTNALSCLNYTLTKSNNSAITEYVFGI